MLCSIYRRTFFHHSSQLSSQNTDLYSSYLFRGILLAPSLVLFNWLLSDGKTPVWIRPKGLELWRNKRARRTAKQRACSDTTEWPWSDQMLPITSLMVIISHVTSLFRWWYHWKIFLKIYIFPFCFIIFWFDPTEYAELLYTAGRDEGGGEGGKGLFHLLQMLLYVKVMNSPWHHLSHRMSWHSFLVHVNGLALLVIECVLLKADSLQKRMGIT